MSKKTKTTNDPWKPAQPYILQGLQQSGAVQQAQQPKLDQYSADQMATYGRVAPGAEAGIYGAQGLVNDTIGGKYLNANPYLDKMMATTNANIADTVNGQFTAGGRYGSGMHAGVLAKQIGEANNALQYQNYADERGRQQAAVGQASGLMGGAQSLLNNAADLPWIGVSALNGNVRQASNGYGTQTTTTSDPMGTITGLAGAGLKAYSTLSDARAKDVGEQVGTTPDGLPIYNYTYKGDSTPQTGVIAQDVAQVRPDAVEQRPDGMLGVDYGKLGMPDPTALAQTATGQAGGKRIDQPGFAGWVDRLTNPDGSTSQGRAGILGEYLMAASGPDSGFEGLGRGFIAARDDAFRKGEAAATLADRRALMQAEVANMGIPRTTPAQLQILAAMGIDPASPRGQAMLERSLNGYGYSPEAIAAKGPGPLVPTANGYQTRPDAIGQMPYRAAPMGGGVPPATAAKYRAEAAAAIAAGAPAAQVNARLAQILGGQ